jgi:hypothetical protein
VIIKPDAHFYAFGFIMTRRREFKMNPQGRFVRGGDMPLLLKNEIKSLWEFYFWLSMGIGAVEAACDRMK